MKITCLGSGDFSLAIASLLSEKKENTITIWSHEEKWINTSIKNKTLKSKNVSIPLKENIVVTHNFEEALYNTEMVFILVNSKFLQDITVELKEFKMKNIPIFIGTKGILDTKPYFFSHYLKKSLKTKKIGFFAGPNLASDLSKSSPCIITLASKKKKMYKELESVLPDYIKLEYTKYIEVIELSSILKNIYAIGSGIIHKEFPYNSTMLSYASLASKELAHILYDKFDFEDLEMYSGILGDFFLTNTSLTSRNFTLGSKRQENATLASKYVKTNTVEGYTNLESMIEYLGEKKYPILTSIYKIIYKNEKTDTLFDICFKN